jgi:streptomycin 6-kinase
MSRSDSSGDFSKVVPDGLVLKGAETSGQEGLEWLGGLPTAVSAVARQWSLRVQAPFAGLSYNYAAPVERADGSTAVLKLRFPSPVLFFAEVEALRLYDGDGVVRLLEVDFERRALLLERALPGVDLWSLQDEDRQAEIMSAIMRRLWRPVGNATALPTAASQFQRMAATAPGLARDGFPLHWVERGCAIFDEIAAASPSVLLHGDLHQANILSAEREPWLAIDPHGLIGPPALDTVQMVLNVLWTQIDPAQRRRTIADYADRFSALLPLDRSQILLMGLARAVLNAFWSLEDGGDWQRDFAIVEDYAGVQ